MKKGSNTAMWCTSYYSDPLNSCNVPKMNKYYFFNVEVSYNTGHKESKLLRIPSEKLYSLRHLRQKLYDERLWREDKRIYYIDDDSDSLPIDSEYEFQELLKFARTLKPYESLRLLVKSEQRMTSDSDLSSTPDTEHCLEKQTECVEMIKEQNVQDMENIRTIDLNGTTHEPIIDPGKINQTPTESGVPSEPMTRCRTSKASDENTSPPPWFIEYMESMKKEMTSAVTQEVVKNVTEVLSKHLDSLSLLSNELNQFRKRPHSSLSKRQSRCTFDSHLNEKDQKNVSAQDEGQFSDASIERVDEPQDVNIATNHEQLLQQAKLYLHDLDNIKDQIHEFLKEKQYYRVNKLTNNLDTGIACGEQKPREPIENSDNNAQEDILSYCISPDVLEIIDGELRMNCSITGNREMNVDSFYENTWCDNVMEDIDKISHCSGCSMTADDREEDDHFEIINMPNAKNADSSLTQSKAPVSIELRQRDSNRDSPSFELLSETSSTPSSLYVNEEHFSDTFSANEKDPQPAVEADLTASASSMVDIHDKIYNEHLSMNTDVNIELEKRSDGAYSFVAETLPVREIDSFKSSHANAPQTSNEQKTSQCNGKNSDDDVRSSRTSYLSAECDQNGQFEKLLYSKLHSQSRTDLGDFMQSFHSHTTSVTDNADVFSETYTNLGEQPLHSHSETSAKNTQEAATVTTTTTTTTTTTKKKTETEAATATATATATTSSSSSSSTPKKSARYATRDKKNRSKTAEARRCDTSKSSRSQQSNRGNGSDGHTNRTRRTFNEQMPNTGDPVLILPGTLVTMAAQMGSIAYITARDMLEKLRSHNWGFPEYNPVNKLDLFPNP